MAYKVTLIPGDGSGPDIVVETRRCIDATGVKIDWEIVEAGLGALEKQGTPLPQDVLDSVERNHVALKGPITTPSGTGYRSINVQLRHHFDLFACVRPCKTIKGLKKTVHNVDIVVIRENTEDLYAGIEFKDGEESTRELIEMVRKSLGKVIAPDASVSLKPISRTASKRIAQFAFKYAQDNRRKKVTVLTKANIMKFTDGLFYEEAEKVARDILPLSLNIFSLIMRVYIWFLPPRILILCLPPTFMVISFQICALPWWVVWEWFLVPIWERVVLYLRQSMDQLLSIRERM